MKMPLVPRAVVGLMSLIVGCVSAAAAPSSVVPMEEPQPGDRWIYEIHDEITGEKLATREVVITEVTPTDISARFRLVGTANNEGFTIYDRSWNVKTNQPWKYSPNDGTGVRLPLAAGKSWALKSTDTNSTAGVSFKRSGTVKVVAQESVTTRAGTFDTFKIETSYQSQNANDPTKKAQVMIQIWYAPLIDHWVKRSFVSRSDGRVRERSTVELVEYGRR